MAPSSSQKQRAQILSKSSFLSGLQCSKLLWTLFNAKELVPATDQQTLTAFDQGREVGLLAGHLFPNGIEVAPGDFNLDHVAAKMKRLLTEQDSPQRAEWLRPGADVAQT